MSSLAAARLPRPLHPVAWWLWALALAAAASRTGNPLLLALIFAVLGLAVTVRRGDAPWARAFGYYLLLALSVIVIRVLFRAVFASGTGPDDHILFTLPHLPTPDWYAGIQLGGPVSLEAVLSAALDGLRLACLLCCIGAANTLANPKRALRVLPGALYELGVAVTVALTVAPQLVESVQRVARARRLRAGRTKGLRALRAIALPVLHDALDRSLRLAAAMDSRGYGRTGPATRASRLATGALMLTGMTGLCVGAYGLLDPTVPGGVGVGGFAVGAVLCTGGLILGGRRVSRSRYRPDPWQWPEWTVAVGGLTTAVVLAAATGYDPAALGTGPLRWPTLPVLPAAAILLAAVAALAAPPPPPRHRPAVLAGALR
ncbi:energy-coupling factor transporter transmembrane component T [Catellatospora tritici]|uniref:energy-coupling factor transporter transmembrane component T n=1 Tax=Catellatospora tritici TaxID=2851566 RepID=UPI001C2CCD01|nr:energy-coupling factor transporter transmembrane component T [Catellatospora tritici]MBV1853834.1 energy-coupling factor transporter transmembrane protein EcfT [Catellatospora tritici]